MYFKSTAQRHAEFARACVHKILNNEGHPVRYCGVIQKGFKQIREAMQSTVYKRWDTAASSPAKERPRDATETELSGLDLAVVALHRGKPCWPAHLMEKFDQESQEFKNLQKLKETFEGEFGVSATPGKANATVATSGRERVSGSCDYTIDGGVRPVDVERDIQPETVALVEFNAKQRQA